MIFHDDASTDATVIEVRCTTKIGILHRITKALAEVGLDIRHATVQTVGLEVVDTFYVRNWSAELITDPSHRVEIERAILHAVGVSSRVRIGRTTARAREYRRRRERPVRRARRPRSRAVERGARRHRPHRAGLHREPVRARALRGGAPRRRRHQGGSRRAAGRGRGRDRDPARDRPLRAGVARERRRGRARLRHAEGGDRRRRRQRPRRDPAGAARRLRHLAVPDRLGRHRLLARRRSR